MSTVTTLPASRTSPTFKTNVYSDIVHGSALVPDLRCVADILGLFLSPLAEFLT